MGTKKARRRRGKGRPVANATGRLSRASLLFPSVVALGNEALREAFRVWWNPSWEMGKDFQKLTGATVVYGNGRSKGATIRSGYSIELGRLAGRSLLRGRFRKKLKSTKSMVNVCIRLRYPLAEERTKVVAIDRRYPGEIFAHAHDFYRELYAEDDKRVGNATPKGSTRFNRVAGPLIWGHDISDLVFESCAYKAYPRPQKVEGVRRPVEGEFTFGIGS